MLSFHNDMAIKAKYLARVEAHRKADNLIRGTGWTGHRGCAIGCTLEDYDHSRYPVEMGLPEWLARLEDTLFEGMTETRAMEWPATFLDAIPLGVSEDRFEREVKAPFLIFLLRGALTTFDNKAHPDVTAAVEDSIALWQRADIGSPDWQKAAEATAEAASLAAARATAEAASLATAEAAARAAARAAAWAAAWAARAAAEAAWATARAPAWATAWAAAWAAARATASYDSYADELLRLLKGLGE